MVAVIRSVLYHRQSRQVTTRQQPAVTDMECPPAVRRGKGGAFLILTKDLVPLIINYVKLSEKHLKQHLVIIFLYQIGSKYGFSWTVNAHKNTE